MSRPNILLLHCHDLGRYLGCYGVHTVHTPNLDGLAADGVRFNEAFCAAPQCSPSRAALFTGRYPHATGVLGLTHGDFGWDLHPGERHIAGVLREAGYRTELIGVHHESRVTTPAAVAAQLGFDHVDTGGLADAVSARATARLSDLAGGGRPFYLQVGYIEPHRLSRHDDDGYMGFLGNHIQPDRERGLTIPNYLVDDEPARDEIAELQGAVRHMDHAVGAVLSKLRELGLDRNTIVAFTTDHGLALPRAKCSLYDPGIEVALVLHHPGQGWTGGRAVRGLVSNVDIVPTLLEAVGIPVPHTVHGRSLVGELRAGDVCQARDEVYAELTYHSYYDPRRCIRTGRYKLIVNFSSAPAAMDPSDSWRRRSTAKVKTSGPGAYHPAVELYDLRADPLEFNDVAQKPDYALTRHDLLGRLHDWMVSTQDPLLAGPVPDPLHAKAIAAMTMPGPRR